MNTPTYEEAGIFHPSKTYTSSMIMFASLGLFGFIFAILLKKADAREGGILEHIGKQASAT